MYLAGTTSTPDSPVTNRPKTGFIALKLNPAGNSADGGTSKSRAGVTIAIR